MPFPAFTPTMPTLLRWSAARFGAASYLIVDGQTLTYAGLERRSARLARTLLAEGVGKGDRVGILMPNSVDWALAWFASTRIGAIAVPLNTFYKAEELAWTLRHADVRAVLTWPAFRSNDFLSRLEQAVPTLADQRSPGRIVAGTAPYLRTIAVWGPCDRAWATVVVDEATAGAAQHPEVDAEFLTAVESCVTPADDAVIIYTSGSTGEPKAPVHTQGTLIRHAYNLTHVYVVTPDDVLFTAMPFFWVGGLVTGLNAVIHHGATLVSQPAFDAGEALRLIEQHRATITLGWPQQGKALARHPEFPVRDLTSIRRTSMPAMVPADRRPVGADSLGMTELCGNHLGVDPYLKLPVERRGTVGPSIDGLTHRIVAPGTEDTVPAGTVGEIWVRGYALMQRLYKREREDVFTPDGFYRTGDCGSCDADGWVTFTGRLGDMIKTSGGTNVTPAEVESALTACDGVIDAYVVGASATGEGTVVTAAVVPDDGCAIDGDVLRGQLRRTLSAYKIPKYIWITARTDLPFTHTGKISRAKLEHMMQDRLRRYR